MIRCYFGLPRVGKSTILTAKAQKELKRIAKGKSRFEMVLTNFYCQGCGQVNYSDLGVKDIKNAYILLDELTLDADSRSFKQFTQEKKEFFIQHGKDNVDVDYFTQQWDGIDKKIRDLTFDLFYVKKCFANYDSIIFKPLQEFSVARRIYRHIAINEHTNEIENGYRFPTTFERWFSKTKEIYFRPKWYKYFYTTESHHKVPRVHFDYVDWDDYIDSLKELNIDENTGELLEENDEN